MFSKLSSRSHVSQSSSYPFQRIRYSRSLLIVRSSTISSTSHSSSPSGVISGAVAFGTGSPGLRWKGMRRETWNTLWILYEGGSCRRYACDPTASSIKNGPTNLAVSFLLGLFILRFFALKRMRSPLRNKRGMCFLL